MIIYDVTKTQNIVALPAKALRGARSALNSLIPTAAGSAMAITYICSELRGKLNSNTVRGPLLNASLPYCVLKLKKPMTAEEVDALFKAASQVVLKNI